MASKYFDEMYQKTSPESKVFTSLSFDIIDQIHQILKDKGISQRELAKELGKSESEISKWLSPGHNLTLNTLAKISLALDKAIIETPLRNEGHYDKVSLQNKKETRIVSLNTKRTKKYGYNNFFVKAN